MDPQCCPGKNSPGEKPTGLFPPFMIYVDPTCGFPPLFVLMETHCTMLPLRCVSRLCVGIWEIENRVTRYTASKKKKHSPMI